MTQLFQSNQTSDHLASSSAATSDTSILSPNWPIVGSSSQDVHYNHTTAVGTVWQVAESEPVELITPTRWSVQIRDLGDEKYELVEPMMIVLEEYPGDEVIIARYPELEVFGEGETEADAILQLRFDIIRLYDELSADDPTTLGPLPRSWQRILNKLINKV